MPFRSFVWYIYVSLRARPTRLLVTSVLLVLALCSIYPLQPKIIYKADSKDTKRAICDFASNLETTIATQQQQKISEIVLTSPSKSNQTVVATTPVPGFKPNENQIFVKATADVTVNASELCPIYSNTGSRVWIYDAKNTSHGAVFLNRRPDDWIAYIVNSLSMDHLGIGGKFYIVHQDWIIKNVPQNIRDLLKVFMLIIIGIMIRE